MLPSLLVLATLNVADVHTGPLFDSSVSSTGRRRCQRGGKTELMNDGRRQPPASHTRQSDPLLFNSRPLRPQQWVIQLAKARLTTSQHHHQFRQKVNN